MIDTFEFLKFISKGAFGRVWLVRKKATGDLYAMKIIEISLTNEKSDMLMNIKKERRVFEVVNGEFIVKAIYTFRHLNFLCFVMEFMPGGDFGCILE